MYKSLLFSVFIIVSLFSSCKKNDKESIKKKYEQEPYIIDIPKGFPTNLNIPEDNKLTKEGVALGRMLFYDGRLSGRTHPDSLMSCATCHIQENGFEVGVNHKKFKGGHPFGLSGKLTPHVGLPLINLVWNFNGYGWNGFLHESNPNPKMRKLEDFVWMSIVAEHEINGDTTKVVKLFNSIEEYRQLFGKAFGSEVVTMDRISKAIAQFIRTLISSDSKFDKYLRGEYQLSASELRGFVLFTTEEGADCFHCHGSAGNPLFTTNKFYNNGKEDKFTGEHKDPRDRYSITNDPMDLGAYRAPTLRNIEFTGPYMHDGRFKTLEEVIDFYSHDVKYSPYIDPLMHHVSKGGIQLNPQEKRDLLSFIKTLTDETFINKPEYSAPENLPKASK